MAVRDSRRKPGMTAGQRMRDFSRSVMRHYAPMPDEQSSNIAPSAPPVPSWAAPVDAADETQSVTSAPLPFDTTPPSPGAPVMPPNDPPVYLPDPPLPQYVVPAASPATTVQRSEQSAESSTGVNSAGEVAVGPDGKPLIYKGRPVPVDPNPTPPALLDLIRRDRARSAEVQRLKEERTEKLKADLPPAPEDGDAPRSSRIRRRGSADVDYIQTKALADQREPGDNAPAAPKTPKSPREPEKQETQSLDDDESTGDGASSIPPAVDLAPGEAPLQRSADDTLPQMAASKMAQEQPGVPLMASDASVSNTLPTIQREPDEPVYQLAPFEPAAPPALPFDVPSPGPIPDVVPIAPTIPVPEAAPSIQQPTSVDVPSVPVASSIQRDATSAAPPASGHNPRAAETTPVDRPSIPSVQRQSDPPAIPDISSKPQRDIPSVETAYTTPDFSPPADTPTVAAPAIQRQPFGLLPSAPPLVDAAASVLPFDDAPSIPEAHVEAPAQSAQRQPDAPEPISSAAEMPTSALPFDTPASTSSIGQPETTSPQASKLQREEDASTALFTHAQQPTAVESDKSSNDAQAVQRNFDAATGASATPVVQRQADVAEPATETTDVISAILPFDAPLASDVPAAATTTEATSNASPVVQHTPDNTPPVANDPLSVDVIQEAAPQALPGITPGVAESPPMAPAPAIQRASEDALAPVQVQTDPVSVPSVQHQTERVISTDAPDISQPLPPGSTPSIQRTSDALDLVAPAPLMADVVPPVLPFDAAPEALPVTTPGEVQRFDSPAADVQRMHASAAQVDEPFALQASVEPFEAASASTDAPSSLPAALHEIAHSASSPVQSDVLNPPSAIQREPSEPFSQHVGDETSERITPVPVTAENATSPLPFDLQASPVATPEPSQLQRQTDTEVPNVRNAANLPETGMSEAPGSTPLAQHQPEQVQSPPIADSGSEPAAAITPAVVSPTPNSTPVVQRQPEAHTVASQPLMADVMPPVLPFDESPSVTLDAIRPDSPSPAVQRQLDLASASNFAETEPAPAVSFADVDPARNRQDEAPSLLETPVVSDTQTSFSSAPEATPSAASTALTIQRQFDVPSVQHPENATEVAQFVLSPPETPEIQPVTADALPSALPVGATPDLPSPDPIPQIAPTVQRQADAAQVSDFPTEMAPASMQPAPVSNASDHSVQRDADMTRPDQLSEPVSTLPFDASPVAQQTPVTQRAPDTTGSFPDQMTSDPMMDRSEPVDALPFDASPVAQQTPVTQRAPDTTGSFPDQTTSDPMIDRSEPVDALPFDVPPVAQQMPIAPLLFDATPVAERPPETSTPATAAADPSPALPFDDLETLAIQRSAAQASELPAALPFDPISPADAPNIQRMKEAESADPFSSPSSASAEGRMDVFQALVAAGMVSRRSLPSAAPSQPLMQRSPSREAYLSNQAQRQERGEPFAPAIQRAITEEETTPTESGASQGESDESPELNINQLASDVMRVLRGKLRSENERLSKR